MSKGWTVITEDTQETLAIEVCCSIGWPAVMHTFLAIVSMRPSLKSKKPLIAGSGLCIQNILLRKHHLPKLP